VRLIVARPKRRIGNVPAEATRFVGRRRELAEIRKTLDARLVSLVGPGGVGKTRLAVRMTTDRRRGFAGGAWWVELAEIREAALVTNAVVAALDLRDLVLGDRKQELLAGLPNTVVELGPGTGANLRCNRTGTTLLAVEPNVHMHARLKRAATEKRISLQLLPVGAQHTGLAQGSDDAVVCTLVLCTVPDPTAVLTEVRQVLQPGGRLLILEHVRAPHRSGLGLLQRVLRPLWRWAFVGCDLRRPTAAALDLPPHQHRDRRHSHRLTAPTTKGTPHVDLH